MDNKMKGNEIKMNQMMNMNMNMNKMKGNEIKMNQMMNMNMNKIKVNVKMKTIEINEDSWREEADEGRRDKL